MNSTKERILDVSTELFRRQGLNGTGIKQILTAAGAPFGSLYHHFPGGKDQLAAETIARAGEHYGALVATEVLAQPDLVAGIREAFHGAGRTLVETDWADACPIETIALEVASTNDVLRRATADVFTSWFEALGALLVAGGVAEDEAPALARTIIATLEGAFVLDRATRTTEALDAAAGHMAALVAAALAAD